MKTAFVFFMLLFVNIIAQLEFHVTSDKESYEYGEPISITCGLINKTDSTIGILFSSYSSCQASFEFDNYTSSNWSACLPTFQEINIPAKYSREYNWVLHPEIIGLPGTGGQHKVICSISYRFQPDIFSEIFSQSDTINIEAPMFLGGQLNVSFEIVDDSLVTILRDSLGIGVVEREGSSNIYEVWQIQNIAIDSIYTDLQNNDLLKSVEYNRLFEYNSIDLVTSVNVSNQLEHSYYLSNAYPNPFNPTTKIEYFIPTDTEIKIVLYDILGNKVKTLVDDYKKMGNYTIEINGNNLTSGVYIYKMLSKNHAISKKVLLIK
ncbi:MAG: T9SS type A sorting domain-containing protein [Bacteroidetes bacterium]|nr:T9SS type A sorting domain-containing protein [Bacteroidota bacterium]MBU1678476.1 T9SS type A sorting domain-containing protein [Bacteroidota bacterium]MBU2507808.1 T9SS type A sorting domain-containing protein [Bacteroidota bacterium]